MAEYAAIPSCAKIHLQRSCYKVGQLIPRRNSCSRTVQRKHVYRKCGIAFRSSPWEVHEFSASSTSVFERRWNIKERSLRCCCFGLSSMPSNGVVIVDQVLLMGSVILAYMAGVVPSKKTYYTSGKNVSDSEIRADDSTSSGSAMQSDIQVDVGFAWDEVKAKLLGGLDAIQSDGNLDSRVVEYEKYNTKRPLSLYAIAEGPRLRLLLTTLQRLQKEVGNISGGNGNTGRSYWLAMISEIMQRCSMLVFDAWLEDELPLEKKKHDNANFQTLFKKLKGDDSILQNLKKSGKEDLYAEFLFLLRFGSVGVDCRYEMTFLSRHGVDILEDLVITLANGITSSYLELISVDSNMSSDMNRLGLDLCSMSTRALQRLRNEVALDRWLHQNLESVVSMYEDRFDLCTFGVQLLDDPSKGESKKLHWWQKLTLTPQMSISSLHYVVINQLSIAVKRTEELRALTGWRYYFSLFLEFSDIAMPLVKVVFAKISSAISFFLVCLIGRSLGLIYTGIRQSLGWRFFVKSCLIPGMIILLQLVGDMISHQYKPFLDMVN